MTTYTAIPDASLEPGKPARAVDAILLRDNPIAITEGASGAPKNQTASYTDLSVTTPKIDDGAITLVKTQHNGAVGAIGTWGFFHKTTAGAITPGSTIAGSSLDYTSALTQTTTSPSGTWRCMGYTTGGGGGVDANQNTLFLRIS